MPFACTPPTVYGYSDGVIVELQTLPGNTIIITMRHIFSMQTEEQIVTVRVLFKCSRLMWSIWLWLSGLVTIHEPSCRNQTGQGM